MKNNIFTSALAYNLRRILCDKQLTYAELAREFGCSRQTIANWASGYNNPTLANLEKLANFLEIDRQEFFRKIPKQTRKNKHIPSFANKYTYPDED